MENKKPNIGWMIITLMLACSIYFLLTIYSIDEQNAKQEKNTQELKMRIFGIHISQVNVYVKMKHELDSLRSEIQTLKPKTK